MFPPDFLAEYTCFNQNKANVTISIRSEQLLFRQVSEELTRGNSETVIQDKVFCIVFDNWIPIHGDTDIGNGLSVYKLSYANLSLVIILTAIPLEMIFKK